MNILLKALNFSHLLIGRAVKDGDLAVDATAGNGYDTVFLAKLVGEKGKVFSFDIQDQAIAKTKENLLKNELLDRVQLIQDGHENMTSYVNDRISAVMFNLGYLPGSDHQVVTKPQTT
ncbi:MAG: SAM-dependent methyltransferase, partial [Firmicutes bacterium HGW-Firmicutes-13]